MNQNTSAQNSLYPNYYGYPYGGWNYCPCCGKPSGAQYYGGIAGGTAPPATTGQNQATSVNTRYGS